MITRRQPIWLTNRAFKFGTVGQTSVTLVPDRFSDLLEKKDLVLRVDNEGVVWGVPKALIKHWDE